MPPKLCSKIVKKATATQIKLAACNTPISGGQSAVCPNRENHLLKFPTGWCQNGWCEGVVPESKSGNPAPSCKFFLTCPCSCHSTLDKMFNASERERILVDRSSYRAPERTWWMPSDDPLPKSSNIAPSSTPVMVESPAPGYVPPVTVRSFAPTNTGRTARGELESWVNNLCSEWLIEKYSFPCTPGWMSEEIGKTQGIKSPSVGAIDAVLKRWVEIGYIEMGKKPNRFIKYTDKGLTKGLDGIKAEIRRTKKTAQSNLRRGVRS